MYNPAMRELLNVQVGLDRKIEKSSSGVMQKSNSGVIQKSDLEVVQGCNCASTTPCHVS